MDRGDKIARAGAADLRDQAFQRIVLVAQGIVDDDLGGRVVLDDARARRGLCPEGAQADQDTSERNDEPLDHAGDLPAVFCETPPGLRYAEDG